LRPSASRIPLFLAASLASAQALAQALAPGGQAASQEVAPPRLTRDSPAVYPEAALDAHFHEAVTVILVLEVDVTGGVVRARPEAVAGHGFDEAALAAAKKLHFAPAMRGDKPVAARIRFRYDFRPPPPRLSGRAASRVSDAPLAGAQVTALGADGRERTTTADADGAFRIADLPPGRVRIRVTARGRAPDTIEEELEPGQETHVVFRLAAEELPAAAAPDSGASALEVEVKGERPPREVTKRTLDKSEIALIPGTGGDALKSLVSLPGVARPPPLTYDVAVRGSAPMDTPVFVGGTAIPQLYHFGGLSSVVPTEMLEKIDFYPGNFSAKYGRGTGGLVEVSLREPKRDGYHGMAQLDMVDARLMVEGPIAGGWSFLVAGRRSWFDVWLAPILKRAGAGVTIAPRYYDGQVVIAKEIDQRSSFRLTLFGSNDAIDVLQASVSSTNPASSGGFAGHIGFWRLQARYQNELDGRAELKVIAAVGMDSLESGAGTTYRSESTTPVSARVELSQKVSRGVTANTGFDLSIVPDQINIHTPPVRAPGVASNGPGDLLLTTSDTGSEVLPAMYTEWELVPRVGTRIVPGLRADWSSPSRTWDISPRLVVRQDVTRDFPRTVLKAGFGLFYQPPQPIDIDPVFGTPGLPDSRALQLDAGFEQDFTRQLGLSVDVFYKALDRLVVPNQGSVGTGLAYGSEILLRYKADERFFGWLTYTISRGERRDGPHQPVRRFEYDQPHVLAVLGSYLIGRGVRVGARLQVTSGSLYTPESAGAFDATAGVFLSTTSTPPDNARTPVFHQLDLRVDKTWKFPRWQLTGYLDIQNVYSYQAPGGRIYNYDFAQSAYGEGLPILPSIGLRGEL
jgi:hypothetical protein